MSSEKTFHRITLQYLIQNTLATFISLHFEMVQNINWRLIERITFLRKKTLYHQPKRPAAVETEHPKRVINATKFIKAPGFLELGLLV